MRDYDKTPHRLKIAFIHQPWSIIRPPVNDADSVALLTDRMARRLAGQGCEVTCYCRQGKNQPRVEQHNGVEYRRASVSLDRWVKLEMQALDRRGLRDPSRPFFSSSLCYRQFIGQVIDDLAQREFDVVHVHNFSQFVPLIRARLPHARIVLQMHCEWLNQLDAAMVQHRLGHADLVLGVSDFLAAKVRARFPHLAGRIRHVYNGAETPAPAEAAAGGDGSPQTPQNIPQRPRILYVGRLSPEKGIHTLLDAFALVVAKHHDAQLELIGPVHVPAYEMIIPFCDDPRMREIAGYFRPGVYNQLLHDKVAALPPGSVSFLYQGLPHSELARYYRSASVFVAPSIWEEPFGMPLVEAMSAGTAAAVASDGGAFPEIIGTPPRAGVLFERGNVQALADVINGLLEDPARRSAIARAGQSRAAARFTWDRVARSLSHEYGCLLRPADRSARAELNCADARGAAMGF